MAQPKATPAGMTRDLKTHPTKAMYVEKKHPPGFLMDRPARPIAQPRFVRQRWHEKERRRIFRRVMRGPQTGRITGLGTEKTTAVHRVAKEKATGCSTHAPSARNTITRFIETPIGSVTLAYLQHMISSCKHSQKRKGELVEKAKIVAGNRHVNIHEQAKQREMG
jgi:hypothetical protein